MHVCSNYANFPLFSPRFLLYEMLAKEDEVLNLLYLFEGEEIYVIKEEPQPVVTPEIASTEEIPFASLQEEPSGSVEAALLEEALPLAEELVMVSEMVAPAPIEEMAEEPLPPTSLIKIDTEEAPDVLETVVVVAEPAVAILEMTIPNTTGNAPLAVADSETVPMPEPEPVKAPLPNAVVIVISEHRSKDLNVYDAAFLEKVLQAVDLSLDQVDIMNVHGMPNPNYSYLLRQKTVRHFISFGVPMESLHLYELLPYEVTFFGGIRFLYTDTLEGVRTDIERKKWLWNALKKMFGK
jgi:hypothetical protein